jgi:hypothetical protein
MGNNVVFGGYLLPNLFVAMLRELCGDILEALKVRGLHL